MFSFAQPYWLLLLPVLAGVLWHAVRKQAADPGLGAANLTLLHPDLGHVAAHGQDRPLALRGQTLLHAAALAALLLALAQPQSMGALIPEKPEGRDIVLLLDTSRTMGISDFELQGQRVERLAVLKGVASRFVEQREGDRFGVIVFGSTAATLVPPSFDRDLVNGMLRQVQVGVMGDNTAMADAIGLALKQVREGQALRPALLLFSDNTDNNAGELLPGEVVALAQRMNVAIYTVQIGSDLFAQGRAPAASPSEEPGLQQIASLTGGKYYRADSSGSLQAVVEDIGRLEQTIIRPATRRKVVEWYDVLLLLAAGLLTVGRIVQIRKVAA